MNSRNWKFARMDGVALAAMVAAGAVFYLMGVRPVLGMQEQRAKLQSQVREQQANAAQAATKVEEMRKKLLADRETLKHSPVQLQPGGTVNTRIEKLTELAGRFQLKIDEVQPAEATYGPDYGFVPIRLVGRGNYRTWTAFLHQITQSFADISVDAFQLAAKPNQAAEFHVNLRWYVSPPPAVANAK
jgi:Tfp pilus assembly protein PilO